MIKYIFIIFLLLQVPSVSQEKSTTISPDTTSLRYLLHQGKANGRVRNLFMMTNNASGLTDYYANGLGFGIGYESAPIFHIQVGISGFFMYNLASSDLTTPDKATSTQNRYEVGLFDLQDISRKYLMRLENLYMKYSTKEFTAILGKQVVRTPILNPQDGRLSPTFIEGVVINWNSTGSAIDAGFITQISPRSTDGWYSIGKTVGINPTGVNTDGTKAQYSNNIDSKWIAYMGYTFSVSDEVKVQFWDYHADRLFNCGLVQVNAEVEVSSKQDKLLSALQITGETAIGDGGNSDPQKTYMQANSRAFSISSRLGYSAPGWRFLINYTRITGDGRWLFPREWGRDVFFTFMLRERIEGAGNVNAINCSILHELTPGLTAELSYGLYYMPDVLDYRLNKYGLPSYNHCNVDIRYKFTGVLQGLDMQLLTTYKGLLGESHSNEKYIINRVRLANINFVTNFNF
ncbi:MAG: outer membrane porin, OprD family [Ignavibacteria bacterium]|nr:outer membrane porin, OprD family [Ignavibacteria bacterium]